MELLKTFLIKYKKKGSEKPTHTTIPDINNNINELKYGCSLTVNKEDMNDFYNNIYDLLFNKKQSIIALVIVLLPQPRGPVIPIRTAWFV